MELWDKQSPLTGELSICRTKRDDQVTDTITLRQAVADLAYKGPGGNGEVEKRLKAGHTLENASFIYCTEAAQRKHIKL